MYVGPETLMPLASALAAVVGVLLMFWRKTVGICRASYRLLIRTATRFVPGSHDRG